MVKKRKIPLRICIGCQEKKEKKQLIRIVRNTNNKLQVDLTGKMSGRGAYICRAVVCLQKALKGKRLERNLEAPVDDDLINELEEIVKESTAN